MLDAREKTIRTSPIAELIDAYLPLALLLDEGLQPVRLHPQQRVRPRSVSAAGRGRPRSLTRSNESCVCSTTIFQMADCGLQLRLARWMAIKTLFDRSKKVRRSALKSQDGRPKGLKCIGKQAGLPCK